jgi:hypothetical protein
MFENTPTLEANAAIAEGYQKARAMDLKARMRAMEEAFAVRAPLAKNINSVLNGQVRALVTEKLARQYHTDTFSEMQLQTGIATYQNVLMDVLNKADTTWEKNATWTLVQAGKPITEQPAFAALCKHMRFDDLGRALSRNDWVHEGQYVLPEVVRSPRLGRRVLVNRVLTPEQFDLLPAEDNDADYEALFVYLGTPAGEPRQRVKWTSEAWCLEKEKNTRLSAPGVTQDGWEEIKSGPNPHGRIPGVFVNGGAFGRLWGSAYAGAMLVDITVNACANETLLMSQAPGQVKVPIGPFDDMPPGQVIAHARPMSLGTGAAQLMDFQLEVDRFRATFVTALRTQALLNMNLQGNELDNSTAPESGYAWRMKMFQRDRLALARRAWLMDALTAIYWNDLQVAFVHLTQDLDQEEGGTWPILGMEGAWKPGTPYVGVNPRDVLPPFEEGTEWPAQPTQLRIDPPPPEYPETQDETEKRETYELRMGLTNRVELMMRRNPELTKEAATALVRTNLQVEQSFQRATQAARPFGVPGMPPPAQPPAPPPPPAGKEEEDDDEEEDAAEDAAKETAAKGTAADKKEGA